jgi:hypothetical protein
MQSIVLFKTFINTFSLKRSMVIMKDCQVVLGYLFIEVINVLYDKGIDFINDKMTSSLATTICVIDNCFNCDLKD